MGRRRRDETTASQINPGDEITAPNGLKAKITWRGMSERCLEPNVALAWDHPSDFSVNANHRGQSSSRIFRPDDQITRWLPPKQVERDELGRG